MTSSPIASGAFSSSGALSTSGAFSTSASRAAALVLPASSLPLSEQPEAASSRPRAIAMPPRPDFKTVNRSSFMNYPLIFLALMESRRSPDCRLALQERPGIPGDRAFRGQHADLRTNLAWTENRGYRLNFNHANPGLATTGSRGF